MFGSDMTRITAHTMACAGILIAGTMLFSPRGAAQSEGSGQNPEMPAASPGPMEVHGRLSIRAPKQSLRLGEENAIEVTLRGPALQQMMAEQSQDDGHGNGVNIEGSVQMLTVQQGADGARYVNVVPVALGPIHVSLMADFADGGYERESISTEVIAMRPPEKLTAAMPGGIDSSGIVMDLSKSWRKTRVLVMATWPGVNRRLYVPWKELQSRVIFDKGGPAVRFDPKTGEVDALRLGDALIHASYRGLTLPICVQVRETVEFAGVPKCTELKGSGTRVLPTESWGDAPGADSKLPYTAHDGRKGRFIADDRVEAMPLTHPLKVAEENPIELKVRGPTIARIDCDADGGCTPRDGWEKPPAPFTFEQRPGGSVVMKVFPSKTGHLEFSFLVLFADGGSALKSVSADVGFGTQKPRAIGTSCGNDSYPNPNLPLRLEAGSTTRDLWINACYDGIPSFVVLPPELVKYRVLSEGADPPIRIDDKTGQVTALRAGQALLKREFDGAARVTCVVVVPSKEINDPDVSNCRDLRARYGDPLPEPPPLPKQSKMEGPGAESIAQSLLREQAVTLATLSPEVKDPFHADERLDVVTNGVTAVPGQPNRLSLRVQGPGVLAVTMVQSLAKYFGTSHAPVTYDETQWNPLIRETDGTLLVKIVPLRVGMAEFGIRVLFADGGVAARRFQVPVKPPADQPAHLFNALEDEWHGDRPDPVTTLHLLMKAPDNTRTMFPYVAWGNAGLPIALNPSDVGFAVRSEGGAPVVRLDATTGTMTALRTGHALVTMRYAGAESDACVVVMHDLTNGDNSNCEDLLLPKQAVNSH